MFRSNQNWKRSLNSSVLSVGDQGCKTLDNGQKKLLSVQNMGYAHCKQHPGKTTPPKEKSQLSIFSCSGNCCKEPFGEIKATEGYTKAKDHSPVESASTVRCPQPLTHGIPHLKRTSKLSVQQAMLLCREDTELRESTEKSTVLTIIRLPRFRLTQHFS